MLHIVKKALRHEGGIRALASKTWAVMKQDGVDGIIYRLRFLQNKAQITSPNSEIYLYRPEEIDVQVKAEIQAFEYKPLISIVMPVYNVDGKYLELAFQSILDQWYPNWELCICDDKCTDKSTLEALDKLQQDDRVKFVRAKKNGGISRASNMALELASGEYAALMDHDDELTSNALFEVVKALQTTRHDFIYSDEDKIEESGHFSDPHFKPDFCEDYFLSTNYLSHLGVLKTELVRQVGGWSEGVEGAQDYDLYLKVAEVALSIHHVNKVLYHWRKVPGSTAVSFDTKSSAKESGRISVEQAIARRGIDASVVHGLQPGTYRVCYEIEGEPLISIVIPFKDKFNLLSVCLNSVLANEEYENFEVICVDNNSQQKEIENLRRYFSARDSRIRFVDYKDEFNYSHINNWAVSNHCQGDYVVFMNNDIEILTPDWLVSLLEHAQREEIGAVGVKLLYPTMLIQHAGIVVSPDASNATINAFQFLPMADLSHFSRAQSLSNYSAVTAALMMVKKADFEGLNGFDDEHLKIAYNDVDLCFRLSDIGKRSLYTPFVVAYHYESATRGIPDNAEKVDALGRELQNLKDRHPDRFASADPYYSSNLAINRTDFKIHPSLSRDYKTYVDLPLDHDPRFTRLFSEISSESVCVFAHYDKNGIIAPYVLYLLKEISREFDIVFVSTAKNISDRELQKLNGICKVAIARKNQGYDFGSWKFGIEHLKKNGIIVGELLIANDSVFGPVNPIENIVQEWRQSGADFYGMTDSYEIKHHLQSYFMLFSRSVLESQAFDDFWENVGVVKDKSTLIFKYEIGLSRSLVAAGFEMGCLGNAKSLGFLNNSHARWEDLVTDFGNPFVKIELLRDNPMEIDLSRFRAVISNQSDYDIGLIEEQLKRSGVTIETWQSCES